jgi:hypothetical protein
MVYRSIALTTACLLGISSASRADVVYTFSGGSSVSNTTFTYGFQFTPQVDVTVDALGYFDAGQDGLLIGHQAGIWTLGGSLLASTTVTTANSTLDGPVINGGQFRFAPVTELPLQAGNTYVFGANSPGADVWYFGGTNISNVPSSVAVSSGGFVKLTAGFGVPNSSLSEKYHLGSFTITPEPAALSPLALSLLALQRRNRGRLLIRM